MRMSRQSKSQPLFLNRVLKAVSNLSHGSTVRKIVNQVKKTLRTSPRRKSNQRDLILHIRQALRYGVENGFLKQRAGRYKIDSKNNLSSKASSRRENPRLHLKSRKRTSHSSTASATASTTTTSTSNFSTTDASSATSRSRSSTRDRREKLKPSRQKRRTRGDMNKNKRRRHFSNSNNYTEMDSRDSRNRTPPEPQPEPEPVPEANPPELERRPSRSSSRYKLRRSRHTVEDENNDPAMTSVNCDNEDCLCNLKQQHSSHNRYEEGPSDDYIN